MALRHEQLDMYKGAEFDPDSDPDSDFDVTDSSLVSSHLPLA